MAKRLTLLSVVFFALGLSAWGAHTFPGSFTARADVDVNGPVEPDQTPPVEILAASPPPSPTQVSAEGGTGSYPATAWPSDAADTPNGVQVVSSTESGTWALTGIAIDATTGQAISGATVTLTSSQDCSAFIDCAQLMDPPPAPDLYTITDAGGSFAFVDVPVTFTWTLNVTATGYGGYAANKFSAVSDDTYETTVKLTPTYQTYDLSGTPGNASTAESPSSTIGYASQRQVPPTIRVAEYAQNSVCGAASSNYTTKVYPWRYYLLHVAAAEIFRNWGIAAVKANFAAESNFAWYWTTVGGPSGVVGDVRNTTGSQCFRPELFIPDATWEDHWVWDTLAWRISLANGNIQQTMHHAGSYNCIESLYPADGNDLSQSGAHARETKCGVTDWKAIDEYYYTGTVVSIAKPPVPSTSFTRPSNGITFNFSSQVNDGAGHISNVAWRYILERKLSDGWHQIYDQGWDWNSRGIPTSYTYHPSGSCSSYRVQASNPAGETLYASYNGSSVICPG